jgi:hypothetical protein
MIETAAPRLRPHLEEKLKDIFDFRNEPPEDFAPEDLPPEDLPPEDLPPDDELPDGEAEAQGRAAFLNDARQIAHDLRALSKGQKEHTAPADVRAELARVVSVLQGLSPAARRWLSRGPAVVPPTERPQIDLQAAHRAQRALSALTGSPDLVAELIDRAQHATPRRKEDHAREWLGFVAMALLEDHGVAVNDSRNGPYVELLTILIQAAGVGYDARRIAQETLSNTLA